MSKGPWEGTGTHEMMVGHLRPGDLFFMLGFDDKSWYTCIAVIHTEDNSGIKRSRGWLLSSSCRLHQFDERSAKEITVPDGFERPWKEAEWDVVPCELATW